MRKSFASAVVVLALSLGVHLPSVAQENDEDGPMMGAMGGDCPMMDMMGQGMRGHGMMGRHGGMSAIVDGRLAYLKDELKISDAQTEAWNGYADVAKSRANVMQGMREGMMGAMQKGGAVEKMDIRIKGMESMLESMKALKPATEKLYSVLTDEQKKIADELIGAACGAM
jgi:LTXXQ motif family protein